MKKAQDVVNNPVHDSKCNQAAGDKLEDAFIGSVSYWHGRDFMLWSVFVKRHGNFLKYFDVKCKGNKSYIKEINIP